MNTDTYSAFLPNRINPRKQSITVQIEDLSSAETVYVVMPDQKAIIDKVSTVIANAITTADSTLTISDGDANSMGTIVIATASSAAGDKDTLSPSSNNVVAAGEIITIATNASSDTACKTMITIDFTYLED